MKSYLANVFEEALSQLDLNSYIEQFSDINKAYLDFIQKTTNPTDNIATNKTYGVKGNSKEWFDGEVAKTII